MEHSDEQMPKVSNAIIDEIHDNVVFIDLIIGVLLNIVMNF